MILDYAKNPDLSAGPARRPRGRAGLIAGSVIVAGFCLIVFVAGFLAPYDYREQSKNEPMAPRATPRFRDAQGRWSARPFIYAQRLVDPRDRRYEEDTGRAYPLEFFIRGYQYKLFWFIPTDWHLFGVREAGDGSAPRVYLLGADEFGRDRLSRLLVAMQFSLIVAPLGTVLAGATGIVIGCLAGYYRRWIDSLLMRAADVMMSLPALVLILTARAAFPLELPQMRAGRLLVTIFVALGWAEMARLTRGLVMELLERDFALAAKSIGLSPIRVLLRHILPNAARPLTVQTLLMLPAFLLAETALSFLGAGLQEPEPSWGSMLKAASDLTLLESGQAPVLLAPAFAIALFVLGVRLLSDGLEERNRRDRL